MRTKRSSGTPVPSTLDAPVTAWWGDGAPPAERWPGVTIPVDDVGGRYRFDPALADRACDWFPRFCSHAKGAHAGARFDLLDYQRALILRPIFGWVREDGTRRFRKAYIEIPKKNGKTQLVAGLALYMLLEGGGLEERSDVAPRESWAGHHDRSAEAARVRARGAARAAKGKRLPPVSPESVGESGDGLDSDRLVGRLQRRDVYRRRSAGSGVRRRAGPRAEVGPGRVRRRLPEVPRRGHADRGHGRNRRGRDREAHDLAELPALRQAVLLDPRRDAPSTREDRRRAVRAVGRKTGS
jgi:hypothetical protein